MRINVMILEILKWFKATPLETVTNKELAELTGYRLEDVKKAVNILTYQGHVLDNKLHGFWLDDYLKNDLLMQNETTTFN